LVDKKFESIEDSEKKEEDIWRSIDVETKKVGLQENGYNGVVVCRSMAKEGNHNISRGSIKIHMKESYHEENNNKMRMSYKSSAPMV